MLRVCLIFVLLVLVGHTTVNCDDNAEGVSEGGVQQNTNLSESTTSQPGNSSANSFTTDFELPHPSNVSDNKEAKNSDHTVATSMVPLNVADDVNNGSHSEDETALENNDSEQPRNPTTTTPASSYSDWFFGLLFSDSKKEELPEQVIPNPDNDTTTPASSDNKSSTNKTTVKPASAVDEIGSLRNSGGSDQETSSTTSINTTTSEPATQSVQPSQPTESSPTSQSTRPTRRTTQSNPTTQPLTQPNESTQPTKPSEEKGSDQDISVASTTLAPASPSQQPQISSTTDKQAIVRNSAFQNSGIPMMTVAAVLAKFVY